MSRTFFWNTEKNRLNSYHYLSVDSGFTNEIVDLFGISHRCWHGCGYLGWPGFPLCRFFLLRNKFTPDIKLSVLGGRERYFYTETALDWTSQVLLFGSSQASTVLPILKFPCPTKRTTDNKKTAARPSWSEQPFVLRAFLHLSGCVTVRQHTTPRHCNYYIVF